MPRSPDPRLRDKTRELIAFIEREVPGCSIKFKDDPPHTIPWWHRFAHACGRLVTPGYDTRYTTVIYPHIYFPKGARPVFEETPERYYGTLRHEFIHLKDFQRFHLWFAATYVALLPVVLTMRSYWEMRGYAQNMLVEYETTGDVSDEQVERIARIFASRDYVFMCLPYRRALRMVLRTREDILAGRLKGIYPYKDLPGAPRTTG